MAGWLLPVGISLGSSLLGGLFGGKKEKVPSFSEFYHKYRQEFPETFGLTEEELRRAYSSGTEGIRSERDTSITRATAALPQDSVARGLVPIQAGATAQRNFAEMVGRIEELNKRVALEGRRDYRQGALAAYGAEMQGMQLQLQQEAQEEAWYSNFIRSITDPIEKGLLLQELENLDRAQMAAAPGRSYAGQFMKFKV